MTFEAENDFRYWLKINGYMQDSIEELAYKWNSISIINGQITDTVNQNDSVDNEIPNIEN
jgi:hypothetical protein